MHGRPNTFITLTSNPKSAANAVAAARTLVVAWRNIRRAVKRRYGYDKVPFLAVFEATKAGWPHLHILCRVPWIDQRWLSGEMQRHADAPIVDIRRVTDQGRAVSYVSKYVGKAPHQFATLKRYWCSRDYDLRPAEQIERERKLEPGWQIVMQDFGSYCLKVESNSFVIVHDETGAWAHYNSRWR